MTLDTVEGIIIVASFSESPFGGVIVQMPPDTVQVDLDTGVPGPPGPPGPPGATGPLGPSGTPAITQADVTPLVPGQGYVDVVFGSTQTDASWMFVQLSVVNTFDVNPLNIWPGLVTNKTAAGFRVQLNGLPDNNNYYLHWGISGISITPVPATSYLLSGPVSGPISLPSTFTVHLPSNTTVSSPLTVTPNDGGAGGVFAPTSVILSNSTASATFIYTPSSYGAKTISTTNSGTLTDPAPLIYTVPYATTYTLSGPGSGITGVPSTNFTVALPAGVPAPVTVTPHDGGGGGGGTFTPTTVTITTGSPSATFTYTPASVGTKTISVTNSGGLTDPASISYIARTPPFDPTTITGLKLWLKADSLALSDGAAVATWADSSSNANNATQTGTAQPIFKTNIVNGKPVVRFDGVNDCLILGTLINITASGNFTIVAVHKTSGDCVLVGAATGSLNHQALRVGESGINQLSYSTPPDGGVHSSVLTIPRTSWNIATTYRAVPNVIFFDSTGSVGGLNGSAAIEFGAIGALASFSTLYTTGDVAEVLIYDNAIAGGDYNNLVAYLKTKYGIP